jgi:hypothetical protein
MRKLFPKPDSHRYFRFADKMARIAVRALLMNVNDDARRSKEHIRGNRFN